MTAREAAPASGELTGDEILGGPQGRQFLPLLVLAWFGAGITLGAITGASRLTPIAGAGFRGNASSELLVSFLLQSLAVASVVGTVLAVWGFRRTSPAQATQAVPVAPPV